MRARFSPARGLIMVAAVLTASAALGAPPRKKKPTHAAPAPKPAPATTAAEDDSDPAPKKDDKPAPADDKPAPAAHDAPPHIDLDEDAKPKPHDAVVKTEATPPVVADAPPSDADGDETLRLGRREAARIAAGRIEVAVSASAGVANRQFTYSDPIGNALAPYRLPAAPMASFELEAYPGAASDVPVLRDLGFRGRIGRGFAFDSNTPQGAKLETSWTRFSGELRERLLLPSRHPVEVGVFAGADASYFGMTTKAQIPALLPAARTIALRFGLDGRVLLGWRLSMMLGGAYLVTTSRGEIYDHFRSPRVAGVDADGGFAVAIVAGLEACLTGRYTRYFARFKPALGDPYVAGGALDQQLQVGLGVRYAH